MDIFYLQSLEAQYQMSSNEPCYSQLPSFTLLKQVKIRSQEFQVLMRTLLLTDQMAMESSVRSLLQSMIVLAMVRTEVGSVGENCLSSCSEETENNY